MPDIRLTRPRGARIWLWTGAFATVALAFWGWGTFFRDPTAAAERPQIGAAAGFATADRAPVLPATPAPFDSLKPLSTRDLGSYVHLRGTALSATRREAVWVRASDGRRILVRFEPAPPPEALAAVRPGGPVALDGYLQKIAVAEFRVWMDTLGVAVPKPPPGRKFGDMPDSSFARVDALFIKEYYVSVRPEGLSRPPAGATPPPPAAAPRAQATE